jgi:hypothetical protein
MATFPSLRPSEAPISPGAWPATAHKSLDGSESRIRHGSAEIGRTWRVRFVNITEANFLAILAHYRGQRSGFDSFDFSTTTLAADLTPAGFAWVYTGPPEVVDQHVDCFTVACGFRCEPRGIVVAPGKTWRTPTTTFNPGNPVGPAPTTEVIFGFTTAPVVGSSEVKVNDGPYVLGYHFVTDVARQLTRIGIYKPTQADYSATPRVNQPTTMDHSVGIWDWSNTGAPNYGAPTLVWQQDFLISGTCVASANSTVAPYYCWFDIANGPELDPDVDYVVAATWDELSPVSVPVLGVNLIIQDFKLNETAATQQGAVPDMLIDLDSESYYAPTINTAPQKGFFTVNMELLRL